MTTGNFTDWSGNMLDLGPLYPFVGWEGVMVVIAFIAWIGWHILQIRAEKRQHDDQARSDHHSTGRWLRERELVRGRTTGGRDPDRLGSHAH